MKTPRHQFVQSASTALSAALCAALPGPASANVRHADFTTTSRFRAERAGKLVSTDIFSVKIYKQTGEIEHLAKHPKALAKV